MDLFLTLVSGSQLWLCYLKTHCATKAYICCCTAGLCEVYRVAINPFIEGNAAWRPQEDGVFYMQCHTMKCVDNPMDRNCNPSVWFFFPASPLMSIWTTEVCATPDTKTWTWIFHSITTNTATTTNGTENTGEKKLSDSYPVWKKLCPTNPGCCPRTGVFQDIGYHEQFMYSQSCELIPWNQSTAEFASGSISLQCGIGRFFASGWHFQSCNITWPSLKAENCFIGTPEVQVRFVLTLPHARQLPHCH